jgi:hypothetical protein
LWVLVPGISNPVGFLEVQFRKNAEEMIFNF